VRYGAPLDPTAYGLRRKRELTTEVRQRIAELAGVEVGEIAEVSEPVAGTAEPA
jgi:hypothetical protein